MRDHSRSTRQPCAPEHERQMNGAFIIGEHNVNANHNIVMHYHGRVIEHGTPHAPCNPYANRLPQAPGAKISRVVGAQWCLQTDV